MNNFETKDLVELVKTVVDVLESNKTREVVSTGKNYIAGRVIVITGSGSGFGKQVAKIAASKGGKVVLADISEERLQGAVNEIKAAGGEAVYKLTDVTNYEDMKALAAFAVSKYGAIDAMVNNAGTMPLAFFKDHEKSIKAWDKCIDINFRGVMYGICAVYDQMIKQGRGHIVNISSVYGASPVQGSGVYQATKSAVRFLTGTLRQETQGQIRTTIVNPTGCPSTGLFNTVVSDEGIVGAVGDHLESFNKHLTSFQNGTMPKEEMDKESIKYWTIDAKDLAEKVVYAIDQPWGIDVSDITVRATGEDYLV